MAEKMGMSVSDLPKGKEYDFKFNSKRFTYTFRLDIQNTPSNYITAEEDVTSFNVKMKKNSNNGLIK